MTVIYGIAIISLFIILINWLRKKRKKLQLRRRIIKIISDYGDSMNKEMVAQTLAAQKITTPKDLLLFLWNMSTDGLLGKAQPGKEWLFSLTETGKKLLPKPKKQTPVGEYIYTKGGKK